MNRTILVAGLGFGDEGKGSIIDFLARRTEAHTVIRYNGGAQAAHNVVLNDGKHHTFAQFGSGTFAGAKTFLSEFMIVNPFALFSEAKHLETLGVSNPLDLVRIDRRAKITTPFHIAANRLQEIARANGRHGSCGMGVGETVRLDLRLGVAFKAGLCTPKNRNRALICLDTIRKILLVEVQGIKDRLPETPQVHQELNVLEDPDLNYILDCYSALTPMLVDEDFEGELLGRTGLTIFEGAQGMLLDQDFGLHPHTTWSDITFRNAQTMIDRCGQEPLIQKIGILRGHMTRHGAGPFPTEEAYLDAPTDHNQYGVWQRKFRVGWLDLVLAKYALSALGEVDGIALTHLDLFSSFNKACKKYEFPDEAAVNGIPFAGVTLDTLPLPQGDSDSPHRIAKQESLARIVGFAKPVYQTYSSIPDLVQTLQEKLNTRVMIESHGPTARDKRFL